VDRRRVITRHGARWAPSRRDDSWSNTLINQGNEVETRRLWDVRSVRARTGYPNAEQCEIADISMPTLHDALDDLMEQRVQLNEPVSQGSANSQSG
jgi:hypothetical protein